MDDFKFCSKLILLVTIMITSIECSDCRTSCTEQDIKRYTKETEEYCSKRGT